MPEARLARARATLPIGYVYEPPNPPPQLQEELGARDDAGNNNIACSHCHRPWLRCFVAPCKGRVRMRLLLACRVPE